MPVLGRGGRRVLALAPLFHLLGAVRDITSMNPADPSSELDAPRHEARDVVLQASEHGLGGGEDDLAVLPRLRGVVAELRVEEQGAGVGRRVELQVVGRGPERRGRDVGEGNVAG